MKFGTVYAVGTRQLTWLDETARRPVETWNDRRISDYSPGEDIAAAEFRLGSFVVLSIKLTDILPALDTATDAHAFAEVLAALDQTMTCNGRFSVKDR